MKRAWWLIPLVALALVIACGRIGTTRGMLVDSENATANDIQAWAATSWVQTSQAEFESGVPVQVDTASYPGSVVLQDTGGFYPATGSLASQVLDTGMAGEVWNTLAWDESLETGTDITFEIRASDTSFSVGDGTPGWSSVGSTSPVMSGLPGGRYMQWRAILATSDNTVTPSLHEVRVFHY